MHTCGSSGAHRGTASSAATQREAADVSRPTSTDAYRVRADDYGIDVRQAITDYPVCDLPGAPTATTADGAQLMLWCAPPEGDAYASEVKRRSRCEIDRVPYAGGDSVPDGGMAFRISTDGAVALEASRVVADPDELPKVIREKQLCKKMLAWLEARVECTSSSLRPVGSGSF